MCDNLDNCCRICLDVQSKHVSILEDPLIRLQVKSCLGVIVSEDEPLPKDICENCVSQLCEFYNFQLNARCSHDWLESSLQEKVKKSSEFKPIVQPLPDSEYNSDSLLEFLNSTANIDEYLNNLGKEDIPHIVNMLDRNCENSLDTITRMNFKIKAASPKKKEGNKQMQMEIDVLDSDVDIVKEIIQKEMEPKSKMPKTCYGCKGTFDNIDALSQHLIICDFAMRTCMHCHILFDYKRQLLEHRIACHTLLPLTCNCGEEFNNKNKLLQHYKICHVNDALVDCYFRCKQCSETLKDRVQMFKHVKEHLKKSQQKICDICGHIYSGEESLIRHRKEKHGVLNDVLYRCKICHKTSKDHKTMYNHVKTHSVTQEQNQHLCESCGKSFSYHNSLERHRMLHKQIKCKYCNKKFQNIEMKNQHMCKNQVTVICEKCGAALNGSEINGHIC